MVEALIFSAAFNPCSLSAALHQCLDALMAASVSQGLFDGSKPVNVFAAKFF